MLGISLPLIINKLYSKGLMTVYCSGVIKLYSQCTISLNLKNFGIGYIYVMTNSGCAIRRQTFKIKSNWVCTEAAYKLW